MIVKLNADSVMNVLRRYINLNFGIRVVGNGVNCMVSYDGLFDFLGPMAEQVCCKARRCLTDNFTTKRRGYCITFISH